MKINQLFSGRSVVFFVFLTVIVFLVLGMAMSSTAMMQGEAVAFLPLVKGEGEAATATSTPTATAVATLTPTVSPTPTGPYIVLIPDCGDPPSATFDIYGYNFPTDEDLFLYWYDPEVETDTFVSFIGAPHASSFTQSWTRSVASNTTYLVKVASNPSNPYPDGVVQASFTVPCAPTPTPGPVDLTIIGPPVLISTPPIVAYQPVQFNVTISNTSDYDITQLFFVDVFIDPGIPAPSGTISIPLSLSDGFTALSNLTANTSQVVTITSQLGFANTPETHLVYGMVDSVEQIDETQETNNLSTPLVVTNVTPASTTTPSPTPSISNPISGIVRVRITNWVPAYRAYVTAINSSSNPVAQMFTDANGFYQFSGLPADTYTVTACYELDGNEFFGSRTGVTPPDLLVNIFMLEGSCQ